PRRLDRIEGRRRRAPSPAPARQAPRPGGVCQVEPPVSTSNPTSRNSWADLWQAHCTTREPMRDDHAKSTGFDSVDTVLRDASHPSPRQSLPVAPFSNGIGPATIPTGILPIEPDPEPEEVPAAAAAHRFAQSAGFEMPAPMSRGKIMCVFGCRGGAGATML